MSGIRNFQRRVLEVFVREAVVLEKDQQYILWRGREIFLLGISRGVGTCSDLHGVNIAVFGFERPAEIQGKPVFPEKCGATVLLRDPTEEERGNDGVARMVVEQLKVVSGPFPDWNKICFIQPGRKEIYVNTIC